VGWLDPLFVGWPDPLGGRWWRQKLSDSSQYLSDWFQLGGLSAAVDSSSSVEYTEWEM